MRKTPSAVLSNLNGSHLHRSFWRTGPWLFAGLVWGAMFTLAGWWVAYVFWASVGMMLAGLVIGLIGRLLARHSLRYDRASLMAELAEAKAKRQHARQGQLQRSLTDATTDQLKAEVRHG